MQLNRCPSLNHSVYHSQWGGDVQYACTVGKYQQGDNKVPCSLSSCTCPCTQTGTWTTHTRTHSHTYYRCTSSLWRKLLFISVRYFFLPPSSRPDFSESGLQSGLTNLALQLGTFNLSISFSLCSIYHLHTWHSLHTRARARTHTHTHTHTHMPMIHVPIAVLISSLRSSSSSVRTERTHTGMNHSESCSPNSTQREVLHLTRTRTIYNGLGVHILIIGHRGCWQWTGRWGGSDSF